MIIIGQFGKPFGIAGDIIINSFLENSNDIFKYTNFFLENNNPIKFKIKKKNRKLVADFKSIEKAKEFVGRFIFIQRSDLPKLKKNEFYFSDLEGVNVCLIKKKIGEVISIKNHGAGNYLEIKTQTYILLVPFNKDDVLKVDIKKRTIHLNPEYYEI